MEHLEHWDFLPVWMRTEGDAGDVVLSSRVRLARNIKGLPFPRCAEEPHLQMVSQTIDQALQKETDLGPLLKLRIEDLTNIERLVLVEKHLCSPQFIEHPRQRFLIVNQEQTISMMVNEEDHLRIQAITPGLSLDEALSLANRSDDYLEETLEFNFDESYGYLTACPTNVGTGIRASVMLHLPGLTMVDQVKRVLAAMTHVGINVRGFYGEGTESFGNIYQISNQVTLGHAEEEFINNLKSVCRQLIEQERTVREALLKDARIQVEDRLCRSYGVLCQARVLTAQETLQLLSDVKLGVEMGIITGIQRTRLKELIFLSRAAILQKVLGHETSPAERDFYRAKLVREQLKQ